VHFFFGEEGEIISADSLWQVHRSKRGREQDDACP